MESLNSLERSPIQGEKKALPDFVENSITIPAKPKPIPLEILQQVKEVCLNLRKTATKPYL